MSAQCRSDILAWVNPTGDGDLAPAIGASVRVCSPGATGYPCTPLANIYTDQTLTTVQPLNPFTTDSFGNFTFCASTATVYLETVYRGTVKVQPTYVVTPGITSINGDATQAQQIIGSGSITVSTLRGVTTIGGGGGPGVGPPVLLGTITLSPTSVQGGIANPTGTATLTGPAPTGGATVNLASSNPTAATVPPSVTVAGGGTSGTFSVTTNTVASSTSSVITGNYGTLASATLTVTAAPPAPTPIYGGVGVAGATSGTLNGTIVTLNNGVALNQLSTSAEVSGSSSWRFSPNNQVIYLLLRGAGHTVFRDTNTGFAFPFIIPPIAISNIGGATLYLYQSTNVVFTPPGPFQILVVN